MPTLSVTPVDDAESEVWSLAREVAGLLGGLPWILIGGLMVRIIEAEHGVSTEWTTGDVDAVLDIRSMSTATEEASRRLMAAGFEPERDDSLVFRFVRGHDIVDVLAPDNLGERARLTTVPPDSTMEALGSRQALTRGRTVTVDAGDGPFELPIPSLVGAIVIKAWTEACRDAVPRGGPRPQAWVSARLLLRAEEAALRLAASSDAHRQPPGRDKEVGPGGLRPLAPTICAISIRSGQLRGSDAVPTSHRHA